MQRLPGLPESPGWVWDKHPTAGRLRLLLLGAPDVEGGVFLGGFGRAGLSGVALRWWRQRHLLLCLFCRLRCCPPGAQPRWKNSPGHYLARPITLARPRPLVAPAGAGGGLKDRDQAGLGGGSATKVGSLYSAPARPGTEVSGASGTTAPPFAPAAAQRPPYRTSRELRPLSLVRFL